LTQSDCSGAEDGDASGDDGVDVTNLLDILDGGSSLPPAPSQVSAAIAAPSAAAEDPFAKFGSPANIPPLPPSSLLFSPDSNISLSSASVPVATKTTTSQGKSDSSVTTANLLAVRRRCMAAIMKIPKFASTPSSAVELVVAAAARRTAAPGQQLMRQASARKLLLKLCM
jgi:hypothetical protein